MKVSIPEVIDRAAQMLSQKNGNRPLTKREIIDENLKLGDPQWSRTSVMPDDFCYNRKNKGSRPDDLCIFLTTTPEKSGGPYVYKGRNHVYTGAVFKTWT
jgi:hypothetical protein